MCIRTSHVSRGPSQSNPPPHTSHSFGNMICQAYLDGPCCCCCALVGSLKLMCKKTSRCCIAPHHGAKIQSPTPSNALPLLPKPAKQQKIEAMSHESVYYSRPRTYGKGSRNWYIPLLPFTLIRRGHLANIVKRCQRRKEEVRPHTQVRPQHESSGVPREGGGYGVG